MDCCDNSKKMKGGKTIKMERRLLLWIVVGVLFVAVLFLIFKAGAAGNAGAVAQSVGSAAQSAASSSSAMVGGC